MKNSYCDLLGFEIIGLKNAKNDIDKINILEGHKQILEGLVRDAIDSIDRKIGTIKYPKILNEVSVRKEKSCHANGYCPLVKGCYACINRCSFWK